MHTAASSDMGQFSSAPHPHLSMTILSHLHLAYSA